MDTPGNRWRTFRNARNVDSLHASQRAAQSERVDILHQAAHLCHRADPGSRWCAWARPESVRVVAAAQVGEMVAKIDRNNAGPRPVAQRDGPGGARVGGLGRRLAEWFVAGMDRAGGWYERQVIWFLLAVATVAVNADSMLISEQFWAGRWVARRECCRGGGGSSSCAGSGNR